MSRYTVDSSVVLEWITSVNGKKNPVNFLKNKLIQGKVVLIAPEFLLVEVINVLYWKKVYTEGEIGKFIDWLKNIGIRFVWLKPEQASGIVRLVHKYGVTSYDALFLFTAQSHQCKLLTFDKKLLKYKKMTISVDKVV